MRRFTKPTPQDWKPECQAYLDSFETGDEPTLEYYLTDPADTFDDLFEEAITEVRK